MKWCIGKDVDGVITDDPKQYLEVCKNYDGEKLPLSWKTWGAVMVLNFGAMFFSWLFRTKHGFSVDPAKVRAILKTNIEESS